MPHERPPTIAWPTHTQSEPMQNLHTFMSMSTLMVRRVR